MQALTDHDQMAIVNVPMSDIYMDQVFNTREKISPLDVIDLAKSIKAHGLQQAIVVRPADQPGDPKDKKYVIVMGHRRFMAFTVNEAETIPARIQGGLTDFQYRTLNAIENLKRSDLNMLEEAKCIEHYVREGYSRDDIAQELGMSPGWVQIREMILNLPHEIQAEVAKGTFTAVHIRDLNSLRHKPEEQLIAARKLKEARQAGERKTTDQVLKKPPKAIVKKQRQPSEIKEMMSHYHKVFGFDVCTRILAWCVGEIDNAQVYYSIKAEADKRGIDYEVPVMEA